MKSVRKSVSLVLALCLMASTALAGCGNSAPASSAPAASTAEASSAAASEAPKEDVTLTFWTVGTAQDQQDRITKAINKYLKETAKTNIQIDYQELGWGDDYNQKVNNALNTGSGVDVLFTANWAGDFKSNSLAGNFLELDNYLTKYPEITKILGQDFIDASKINGHTYALPCNKEKFHSWGYLVRSDLVKKYNIDVSKIKSEKDMEPVFDQILKGEPGITPLCVANFDVPAWAFLDWDRIGDDSLPGALYPAEKGDGKIINNFTAPESVAAYKKMKEYLAKKYISADAPTITGVPDAMKTGKYFAAEFQLKPGKDAEMKAQLGFDVTQIQITKDFVTNRETIGAMTAIAKSCKHPDEAMQFINMLYTDPNLVNLLVYGEEGTDYKKNSDGTVEPIQGSGYASANGWRWGDQSKNLRLSYEAADKYDSWKKIGETAPKQQSYGFIFNDTDTTTQTLMANCKAVTQEYYKTLLCGQAKDVDATVKEMDAKYKAAGIDKLLKIMQDQYDAWAKTKK